MFKRTAVLVVSCGALLAGCGTGAPDETEETRANLVESGVPASDIQVIGGTVVVGSDTEVSLEASRERLQRGEGTQEHYRSSNLVGTAVTRICLNPSSTFNSLARLSQGLNEAIINYNVLGLRISFVRGPATGCTANISVTTITGTGASSGLPSGGLPYNNIRIGTGLNAYGLDLVEHIITHQLGHALGLLHTDAYDPTISCGPNAPSGDSPGVGGVLIPGTPTTATPGGSIMNTCPAPTTTGEFSSSDIAALNYLY